MSELTDNKNNSGSTLPQENSSAYAERVNTADPNAEDDNCVNTADRNGEEGSCVNTAGDNGEEGNCVNTADPNAEEGSCVNTAGDNGEEGSCAEGRCLVCGKPTKIKPNGEPQKYCCKACALKNERRRYRKARRAVMKAAFVERVFFKKLYARDRGICGICGKPVKYEKSPSNIWGATVDHIVPLSKGGKHSMSNCRLAHRICNSFKADTGDGSFTINNAVISRIVNTRRAKNFKPTPRIFVRDSREFIAPFTADAPFDPSPPPFKPD